jgi:hypothetical protein
LKYAGRLKGWFLFIGTWMEAMEGNEMMSDFGLMGYGFLIDWPLLEHVIMVYAPVPIEPTGSLQAAAT